MLFLFGSVIEAGSDTTRVSLNQLAAAAALFPDWVERARQELDNVCGANAERLPDALDAPNLPYIKAAAKETVRWKSVQYLTSFLVGKILTSLTAHHLARLHIL